MKKAKLVLVPILLLALVLNTLCVSAAVKEPDSTKSVDLSVIGFEQSGLLHAIGTVQVSASGDIAYIQTRMTLQVYDSSQKAYVDTDQTDSHIFYDTPTYHSHKFDIALTKSYRLKVYIMAKIGGVTETYTRYKALS